MCAFVLSLLASGWRPGEPFPTGPALLAASGATFATVVLGQMANAFACRSATRPPWRIGWLTNPLLIVAVVVELVLRARRMPVLAAPRIDARAGASATGRLVRWQPASIPAIIVADAVVQTLVPPSARSRPPGGDRGDGSGSLRGDQRRRPAARPLPRRPDGRRGRSAVRPYRAERDPERPSRVVAAAVRPPAAGADGALAPGGRRGGGVRVGGAPRSHRDPGHRLPERGDRDGPGGSRGTSPRRVALDGASLRHGGSRRTPATDRPRAGGAGRHRGVGRRRPRPRGRRAAGRERPPGRRVGPDGRIAARRQAPPHHGRG